MRMVLNDFVSGKHEPSFYPSIFRNFIRYEIISLTRLRIVPRRVSRLEEHFIYNKSRRFVEPRCKQFISNVSKFCYRAACTLLLINFTFFGTGNLVCLA